MLSLLPPSGWIVIRTPSRVRSLLCPPEADIDFDIAVHLIVELYSK